MLLLQQLVNNLENLKKDITTLQQAVSKHFESDIKKRDDALSILNILSSINMNIVMKEITKVSDLFDLFDLKVDFSIDMQDFIENEDFISNTKNYYTGLFKELSKLSTSIFFSFYGYKVCPKTSKIEIFFRCDFKVILYL